MIRPALTAIFLLTLAGCDAYTGPVGRDPLPVSSFGAAKATPTASGAFAGVAADQTTVVADASGNGYAFAYARVGAADYGGGTGEANLAVAGVLPGTDLGTAPIIGTASMTGTYRMVVVTNASTATPPSSWTVTRPKGDLTASLDFATGRLTGSSPDGTLTLSADAAAGFADGFAGEVSYAGVRGTFDGVVGPDDAVAAMTGGAGGTFYAGGFVVGR